MKTPINFARENLWLTVVLGTIGPGFASALIQYVLPQEEIGVISIFVALLGGGSATILILLLRIRELSQSREPTEAVPGAVKPDAQTASDESGMESPFDLDIDRPWSKLKIPELLHKTKGLTDVQRRLAIENDVGRWLKVRGSIDDVESRGFGGRVSATLLLPDSTWVILETNQEPWVSILQAFSRDDEVEVIGSIRQIMPAGIVYLEVELLLPPDFHHE